MTDSFHKTFIISDNQVAKRLLAVLKMPIDPSLEQEAYAQLAKEHQNTIILLKRYYKI